MKCFDSATVFFTLLEAINVLKLKLTVNWNSKTIVHFSFKYSVDVYMHLCCVLPWAQTPPPWAPPCHSGGPASGPCHL